MHAAKQQQSRSFQHSRHRSSLDQIMAEESLRNNRGIISAALFVALYSACNVPLCRRSLRRVLFNWDPSLKPEHAELARLYLDRLAGDTSVLALQPPAESDEKGNPQGSPGHQKKKCTGCMSCSGPEWYWRTEAAAFLRDIFCKAQAAPLSTLHSILIPNATTPFL